MLVKNLVRLREKRGLLMVGVLERFFVGGLEFFLYVLREELLVVRVRKVLRYGVFIVLYLLFFIFRRSIEWFFFGI